MDNFAFFCFRSCLKGDSDRSLYDALGLQSQNKPSVDDIKRSYKQASLSLHPDKLAQKGIQVTEKDKEQFLKVKQAYDILSDPKRRKLYDQYGITGLKLIEAPQEINPADLLKNFQVFSIVFLIDN
jgi:DnaJ-class molecular chaperone